MPRLWWAFGRVGVEAEGLLTARYGFVEPALLLESGSLG